MRRQLWLPAILIVCAALPAAGQTFPAPDYFRNIVIRPVAPTELPGPEGLRDVVADGKLRLTQDDTIRLVLLNNTDVQLNRLTYEGTRFAVERAWQPFDPVSTASFSTTRASSPTTSQLDASQTLSQQSRASYTQTFLTGTRTDVSMNFGKFSTDNVFATFSPSITANMNFTVSQPLLRNRGTGPNRAPILIARRNVQRSRADFEAQVSEAVQRAVDQYWGVVQSRENLSVLRRSFEQAEATYKQNKRALELGALPPLDIYRSESQVATRRVSVIQAEYQLRQLEDDFRRTIGADLDPYFRALDLELVEPAAVTSEAPPVDASTALEQALRRRPELESLRLQLANSDTGIRLAHNSLQPDLNFSAFYTSSGRGGNEIDTSVMPPVILSRGGLGDAFDQLGGLDFPTYGFSLTLRLPIRNRSAEADLGNALLSKRRDLYTLRQREQGVALEVRNSVHRLEEARLSIAASRIARDLAQKNLEAEQRKFELGVQTIFFVLDAQTQLAGAEQSLLQSEISFRRAVTALDRATGSLLERHRVQLAEDRP